MEMSVTLDTKLHLIFGSLHWNIFLVDLLKVMEIYLYSLPTAFFYNCSQTHAYFVSLWVSS